MRPPPSWSVFTKPWADLPPDPLGELVARMGFDGIELPVRPGAHLSPDEAPTGLPDVVARLGRHGVAVTSVATDVTEAMVRACAEAGVGMIRTMAPVVDHDQAAAMVALRDRLAAVADVCVDTAVRIGVQPHHGRYLSTVAAIHAAIAPLPDEVGCIVWDAAHDALTGEDPVDTLRSAGDRLGMINLKQACYREQPRSAEASGPTRPGWAPWFGPADTGMADWPRILQQVDRMAAPAVFCLTAQYSDARSPDDVERWVTEDLDRGRGWWADAGGPR